MDKNVILSIRGQQTFADNSDPEVIELVTEGILTPHEGGQYTVRYQESELTGLEGTQTTIQVAAGSVSILREGQVNSQMVFEEGRRHLTMYNTPYGTMAIGVNTRKMKVDLDETGGCIEIDYALEVDHAVAGENLFQIYVRTRSIPQ